MPQGRIARRNFKNFNIPVSYKVDNESFFKDSINVYSIQNVLETRHGITRFNSTAFSASPLSISFFKDNSDNSYILAKDSTILYKANASGAHTSIKTGLTASTKHRAVTMSNRHIIAIEGDGLFQYDGTTFTQLGQAAPTGISVAVAAGGSLTGSNIYQIGVSFYDSTNGFETNVFESSRVTTTGTDKQINITSIPTTAANANIDKIRIYLKDVTTDGDYLFITEQNLGTASYTVDNVSTSLVTPPTTNATPPTSAKYLSVFGQKLAVSGNSTYASDVFFSEDLLPDAFDDSDTSKTINVAGNGPITGIVTGFFSDSDQAPYLVIFKKRHIELYTEVGGSPNQIVISDEVGCVANDTISVINGDVYFMSDVGWHIIENGRLVKDKNKAFSLDNGNINDIFTRSGFTYELNRSNSGNFFSIYYPTLKHYMTFISEGSNNSIYKCYNYEFDIGGFRPLEFKVSFKDGCLGEDSSGDAVVYLTGQNGYIYTYSVKNTKGTDIDANGSSVAIPAFFQLFWMKGDDIWTSYNFGQLALRALEQNNDITVKYWVNYNTSQTTEALFDFTNDSSGFILDVSKLDIDVLGDGRDIARYVGNILKRGQSLLIGIYKTQLGESMSLIEGQIGFSKNGNPN